MTFPPRLHSVPQRRLTARQHPQHGGLLIEGMVSILLISLAALAVVGLQAHAIRIDNHAQYRQAATLVVADLAAERLLSETARANTNIGTWTAENSQDGKIKIKDVSGTVITETFTWAEHLAKLPKGKIEIKEADGAALTDSWVKDIIITWQPPSTKDGEFETLETRITTPKEILYESS